MTTETEELMPPKRSKKKQAPTVDASTIAGAMLSEFFPDQGFEQPTWWSWRTILKTLDAQPLDAKELEFYTSVTGRTIAPTSPPETAFLIAGRGSGKSTAAAIIVCHRVKQLADWAKTRKSGKVLPRGEAVIPIIAASMDQAATLYSVIDDIVAATPELANLLNRDEYHEPSTAKVMRFRHGISIKILSAGYSAVRSIVGAPLAIVDEAAFIASQSDANKSDVETLRALRPTLKKFAVEVRDKGCPVTPQLLILTSPFVRMGEVWKAYERWHPEAGKIDIEKANRSKTLVMRAATVLMNRTWREEDVADEIEADEAARAEYEATFRGITDGFISMERLSRVIDKTRPVILAPLAGVKYSAFVDMSSMAGKDSTALAIAHVADGKTVLDMYVEFKPSEDLDLDQVLDVIAQRCKAYGIKEVIGDKWAPGMTESAFRSRGLRYVVAEGMTKTDLYLKFAAYLPGRGEPAKISLPDDERVIFQFLSLKRKVNVHGNETIDALKDMPEDVANCISGAIVTARGKFLKGGEWVAPFSATKHTNGTMTFSEGSSRQNRERIAERRAMMTAEELREDDRQSLKSVPDSMLHPHQRDGKLYGKQLQQATTADLTRHLLRCQIPTCPSPAHQREDLKRQIAEEQRQRIERQEREAKGYTPQNTKAPGSTKGKDKAA